MAQPRQARNWMFTLNHAGEHPPELLDEELFPEWVTYCVWQLEVGEQGTYHYQGYMECRGTHSIAQIQEIEGFEGAHLEIRRGTTDQAITYCTKQETRVDGPWYHGEPKEQGKRNDLTTIKAKLDQGATSKRIADEHFGSWCRYEKSFKAYKRISAQPRNHAMELIIIIGPSRTGKTRQAVEMAGEDVYFKDRSKWWEDYEGQHTVVWDEFYGHCCPFTDLLRIMDRYPLRLESKGSSIQFNSKRIIFTSNQEPEDWYDKEKTHQMNWAENPLNLRIQEFGRIIRTGIVHRAQQNQRLVWDGREDVPLEAPTARASDSEFVGQRPTEGHREGDARIDENGIAFVGRINLN